MSDRRGIGEKLGFLLAEESFHVCMTILLDGLANHRLIFACILLALDEPLPPVRMSPKPTN
ncbi:MAG: hypothetical protein A3H91_15945 [Gammaproteobacteria bacterium RIFCSPLOWO2_02_FULL_61_13]|nr:MAG: hypothetical protein A3H91_15945 [Gammaproteobacteria bacterium RIFCSPLOWO2_02_FULL_61_13]